MRIKITRVMQDGTRKEFEIFRLPGTIYNRDDPFEIDAHAEWESGCDMLIIEGMCGAGGGKEFIEIGSILLH